MGRQVISFLAAQYPKEEIPPKKFESVKYMSSLPLLQVGKLHLP